MIKIRQAIIVEGKYDKIKLSSIIDGLIIETNGFRIFKDREKVDMIRAIAAKTGVLVLTDSDVAGFKIRNHINALIPPDQIRHAYIPDILGKEKRKTVASKEGKLGVEGMEKEVLLQALERAGVLGEEVPQKGRQITKSDLYLDGLSGRDGSAQRRQKLLEKLSLPEHLSCNGLLGVLNTLMSYEEYQQLVEKISE